MESARGGEARIDTRRKTDVKRTTQMNLDNLTAARTGWFISRNITHSSRYGEGFHVMSCEITQDDELHER